MNTTTENLLRATDKPTWSEPRRVAENIRRELKRSFPGVKISVTARSWSSVYVSWTDGPTTDEVGEVVDKYKAGYFDGQTDCYEYANTEFTRAYGSVRHVLKQREWTLAGLRRAYELRGRNPDDVPADWSSGGRWNLPREVGDRIAEAWSETNLA